MRATSHLNEPTHPKIVDYMIVVTYEPVFTKMEYKKKKFCFSWLSVGFGPNITINISGRILQKAQVHRIAIEGI